MPPRCYTQQLEPACFACLFCAVLCTESGTYLTRPFGCLSTGKSGSRLRVLDRINEASSLSLSIAFLCWKGTFFQFFSNFAGEDDTKKKKKKEHFQVGYADGQLQLLT